MSIDYHRIVEASVLRLNELIKERHELDAEILKLYRRLRSVTEQMSRTNDGTGGLAGRSSNPESLGVTEAVRRALQHYPMWLSPVSIRNLLPTIGFDFSRYKHPLTSIHSVLRRLVTAGEVIRITNPSGFGTAYMWAQNVQTMRNEHTPQDSSLKSYVSDSCGTDPDCTSAKIN